VQALSRKFTIALISTLLFSLLLTIFSYSAASEQSITFGTLLMTFIVLSAPMFLIIGVITSFVFEKYVRSTIMKFISYVITGAALIIPYSQYYFYGSDPLRFSILGAIGAALFYGVQWLFQTYLYREKAEVKM
jgi:hypothetical protein